MDRRVVITGMGVVAPNGVGLPEFQNSLKNGISGIQFQSELENLNFSCQIAGTPEVSQGRLEKYFTPIQLRGLNSSGIKYGVISALDCWKDAGLEEAGGDLPDYDSGIVFGIGILGVDKFREAIQLIDQGKVRRLGSTSVLQTMASGISAYLGGILGCGNQVTTNSSACTTGTEAVLMGYDRIKAGKAKRMLVGSCGESGPYIWGGFDAMRILVHNYNQNPTAASRPMSSSACGIVPGSGAGALLLEDLETAENRGATIYAEIFGGEINSGGQRAEGSMTAPNSEAVIKCIEQGLKNSKTEPYEIDAINGHLTGTKMDPTEIRNWCEGLGREGREFPLINSVKGMTGHCLSASGSIECVATILQISQGFIFGNVNCEDLHPEIERKISKENIPRETTFGQINRAIKASFGFGDVNAVVVFGKYNNRRA